MTDELREAPGRAEESDQVDGVPIPLDQIAPETLHNIVEEFVTRDGTENTESARKVEQVMKQLERGDVEIWFNPKTRTCSILRAGEVDL